MITAEPSVQLQGGGCGGQSPIWAAFFALSIGMQNNPYPTRPTRQLVIEWTARGITHLMSRAAGWLAGLRWIVRQTRPSRRQMKNLTAFERATGWRYSIICTNIPAAGGVPGVPGSHHAQFTGVLHREHAVVEDQVRANKAMGLRNLPSKAWVVNCGWALAASLTAGLAAWCRLLGLYDCDDLKDAEPGTLRPVERARPAGPPRPAGRLEDQPDMALEGRLPGMLAAGCVPCQRPPDQPPSSIAKTSGAFQIGIPAQDDRRALIYLSGGAYRMGTQDLVYATWTDLAGGTGCNAPGDEPGSNTASPCKTRIWFARSTDGGVTWEAARKLNDQNSLNDQFFQRLAVDDTTGELLVVYYDTVSDPGRLKTDVWMQGSTDGGATWSSAVQVTTAETDETSAGAQSDFSVRRLHRPDRLRGPILRLLDRPPQRRPRGDLGCAASCLGGQRPDLLCRRIPGRGRQRARRVRAKQQPARRFH